ncbi:MAG: pilus assembly protein [Clostridiaceae bacterium]
MNKIKKIGKREEGQSLVEFALVLPILLLLIVAIVDFGWVFMAKITVNNAAREGARVYAVNIDKSIATTAANDAMSFIPMTKTVVVDKKPMGTTPPEYEAYVKITGSLKPLVGLFLPSSIEISSESYMKIEYDIK